MKNNLNFKTTQKSQFNQKRIKLNAKRKNMKPKIIQNKLKLIKIKRKIAHKLIQKKNRNKLIEKNRLINKIYSDCIFDMFMEID